MNDPADPAEAPPEALKNSALATASLTLGCIGLVCAMFLPFVLVVPAVICGHLAQKKIRASNGSLGGAGRASTGLVTGYIGLVASVIGFIILSVAIPGFRKARTEMTVNAAVENAHIVAAACVQYTLENNGQLPKDLDALRPFVISPMVFDSPLEKGEDGQPDYVFPEGGKVLAAFSNPGSLIIVEDVHPAYRGGMVVAYGDGHAAVVRRAVDP